MSANQYSYPPPPPPPPPQNVQGSPQAGYQQYQQAPYGQQQGRGGGARGRGRGGYNQGGRGDFQGSQYPPHAGGYNGPPAPVGGYGQQGGQYAGPPPAPASGYPPPQQWRGNEPQLQQQQHHQVQQSPPPAPLSVQNYHPNYAPQVYQPNAPQQQQQPQYGPPQPAQYPQGPYGGQPAPMPQPQHQAQQWQPGPGHQSQPPFNNGNRGRGGRGGGHSGRGGFDAPLMGPPIRMGFDSDQSAGPMSQASTGFPPPYAGPQHGGPVPFSAPPYPSQNQYQSYPSQNAFPSRGGRHSLEPNPFQAHGHSRGRGGMHNRGNKREQFNDRVRHRGPKHQGFGHHKSSSQGAATDQPQKPAADAGAKSGEKRKKKKKRKTNTLGLTPGTEDYQESEDEDDADEESKLAASILGSNMPEEPSDLAAWLEERRKKWPTKARREEKEAELAKRREAAQEQSARDKAKAKQTKDSHEPSKSKSSAESKIEKQQRKAEKLRKQLERAEQKVQEAMKAGRKRKREAGDYGDEEAEDGAVVKTERDAADADTSTATVAGDDSIDHLIASATSRTSPLSSSSSEYTSGSSSDSDSDSSDSSPETSTTKRLAPTPVAAPKKPILQRHCKYFSTGGTCGKKGKCRFVHDQAVRDAAIREKEMNGGVMTLAQRLTQNDREKEDLMVLKSIKYLHERGLLDEPQEGGS